jgi:hypothetical protein
LRASGSSDSVSKSEGTSTGRLLLVLLILELEECVVVQPVNVKPTNPAKPITQKKLPNRLTKYLKREGIQLCSFSIMLCFPES